MKRNALAEETSPYLLQHKDNPVHWQAWSPTALAAARAADKPILLSIGYAACHWCHVMAHESFENRDVAALMNDLFVNIKVDREERPDLDTIYQYALALLGEQGGWPLTMFLMPTGEPFWGGTYFPPEARWGRPGFPDVLRAISNSYKTEREKVANNAAALKQGLARLSAPQGGAGLSIEATDRIAGRLAREVDPVNGGIGDAPKFPQPGVFELLWRAFRRTRQEPLRHAVELTLTHISQGGIYDHVGGGYSRYAVDARWLVPHFEKMLYDNAQLVDLLTLAWQETGNGLYAMRVAETVDWISREMLTPEGGFSSSLDADSEHEEGKFYVWSEAEIDALLGERAPRFKAFYDVSAAGNWEGHTILNRLHHLELADPATEAELAACRAILFHAREERVHPGLDDKVLADWTGLMIAALANAATVFERPDWLDYAIDAFAFVAEQMSDARQCGDRVRAARLARLCDRRLRLRRGADERWCEPIVPRVACRHAAPRGGARRLRQYEPRRAGAPRGDGRRALSRARRGVGGDRRPALLGRNGRRLFLHRRRHRGADRAHQDGAFYLTGKNPYRERAERIVATFAGDAERQVFGFAALINGNELLQRALQIVVRGRMGEDDTAALLHALSGASLPNKVLMVVPPEAALPEGHPAAGKGQIGGRATAYVCEGPVCSLPLTDPAALAADLAQRR